MPTPKKKPAKKPAPKKTGASLEKRVAALETRLNDSWLLSDNFWKRAFAVVGHYIAAYFAIWLGIVVLALASMLIAGALAGIISLFS